MKAKTFLLFAVPQLMGTFVLLSIFEGPSVRIAFISIIAGLAFGFLYPWLAAKIAEQRIRKIVMELDRDETILREGIASYLVDSDGVTGKLALTQKRLLFKGVSGRGCKYASIPLADITDVSATTSHSILKTVLFVHVGDHDKRTFVVDSPSEWLSLVRNFS